MTRQNTCDSVAPSIWAASVSSVGTALIADEKITRANPVWIQIRITINHMLLNGCLGEELDRLGDHLAVLGRPEAAEAGTEQAIEQVGDDQTDADRPPGSACCCRA